MLRLVVYSSNTSFSEKLMKILVHRSLGYIVSSGHLCGELAEKVFLRRVTGVVAAICTIAAIYSMLISILGPSYLASKNDISEKQFDDTSFTKNEFTQFYNSTGRENIAFINNGDNPPNNAGTIISSIKNEHVRTLDGETKNSSISIILQNSPSSTIEIASSSNSPTLKDVAFINGRDISLNNTETVSLPMKNEEKASINNIDPKYEEVSTNHLLESPVQPQKINFLDNY